SGPRGERVLVRRSARRRRSVSITRREGDLVIAVPAAFSARQERDWVRRMVDQLARKEERTAPTRRSDASLAAIARELSDTYLGGRARPTSVTWSTRQQRRWGSCTPAEGTIRLSSRLQGMPDWVLRSVVMHELVHLLVPGHGPEFYALMGRYPKAERARGFLDGVSWAADLPQGIDEPEEGHDPQEGPGPSLELEEAQIPVGEAASSSSLAGRTAAVPLPERRAPPPPPPRRLRGRGPAPGHRRARGGPRPAGGTRPEPRARGASDPGEVVGQLLELARHVRHGALGQGGARASRPAVDQRPGHPEHLGGLRARGQGQLGGGCRGPQQVLHVPVLLTAAEGRVQGVPVQDRRPRAHPLQALQADLLGDLAAGGLL